MNKVSLPKRQPVKAVGLQFQSTVAHVVAKTLQRHGVTEIFGQSLPSLVHLACEEIGIRQIAYRQENTGGYMADGYARTTGKVSVVTAQNGPAATLLVAPLAEALKASIPIVALVQEVAAEHADRNAFQELDHANLFSACAKWVRTVPTASRIEDYIDMAFTSAASGRPGPVVLMLPADLLTMPGEPSGQRRQALGTFPLDRCIPDQQLVSRAAQLLIAAKNPIVIAGGGIHVSGAADELAELQDKCSIPVATTMMGKGAVDETHPLSVGVVGYLMGTNSRTRYLRHLVEDADVVLLVGNRTNQNGTDSWALYPKDATYIQIDIDPVEIGRNYEASVRLVGDAKVTLASLVKEMSSLELKVRNENRLRIIDNIAWGRAHYESESKGIRNSDSLPVRPERIMQELSLQVTPQDILVADASYSSAWIVNYLTARLSGSRFLTPRGLAGLGWGLPMAMGAKIGNPDNRVICVVGDGGFGHAWVELETLSRLNIDVTLIVFNNQILGYQMHAENVKFGAHTSAVYFHPVDHAALANACGLKGVRIEDPADIGPALENVFSNDQATVIDVVVDPDAHPPITSFEG